MVEGWIDEGPGPEDLERFGGPGEAFCPSCGEEVFEDAPACPACGAWIAGAASRRHPEHAAMRRRWLVLMAVGLALLLVWWLAR